MVADGVGHLRALLARRTRARSFYRALHGIQQAGLPRFHLDRYGPFWVATFAGPLADTEEARALGALLAETAEGAVFRSRDEATRGRAVARAVAGACPEELLLEHEGCRFVARLLDPIDPGAYPDSEPLREALRAEAAGKRLLNLFAFTCLFGVVARLAGARSALNVDLARSHLARGKENYARNGLSVDDRDFVAQDALRFCARAERARWDLVVCDPPPLLRRGQRRVASEDLLEEMLALVVPLVAPGGTLHVLQCTARVSPDELRERVRAACPLARVSVRASEVEDLDPSELAPTFKDAVVRIE